MVVFAMIIAVAFQTVNISSLIQWRNIMVVVIAFILFSYTKIHPGIIIISAGLLGAFVFK